MTLSRSTLAILLGAASTGGAAAFVSSRSPMASTTPLFGYLDDLASELNAPDSNPNPEEESREANAMARDQIVNAGPGTMADFKDFGDEFDGGDGQMGVAGDGNKGLEKMGGGPSIASKQMSAKNAWGTSTGYAEKLLNEDSKIDVARAQQLENWANQQEVRAKNQQLKAMSETFDSGQTSEEENWRQLSKFGVERNTDEDLDEVLGSVAVDMGSIDGVIELKSVVNRVATADLVLRNPYMGFADFRAAFTPETPQDWSVEPVEGALMQREDTNFVIKFRPTGPGASSGYLVIETEDFKKTYQVVGST